MDKPPPIPTLRLDPDEVAETMRQLAASLTGGFARRSGPRTQPIPHPDPVVRPRARKRRRRR